jgi:phosphoglycolate phosphatase
MQVADLIALYRERFSEVGIYENAVYPGISEMLTALTKFRHFVATSKPEVYARRIVEHFGLSNHFEQIYGSELSGERADKGDLLEFIMTAETPQAALMIGDREHDVIGARKVGIPCLGVAWGYGSHDELLNAGAIAVVDSPRELIDRLS